MKGLVFTVIQQRSIHQARKMVHLQRKETEGFSFKRGTVPLNKGQFGVKGVK